MEKAFFLRFFHFANFRGQTFQHFSFLVPEKNMCVTLQCLGDTEKIIRTSKPSLHNQNYQKVYPILINLELPLNS